MSCDEAACPFHSLGVEAADYPIGELIAFG